MMTQQEIAELLETVRVLRRENARLQFEISRFLTGNARLMPAIAPVHPAPGIAPLRPGMWPPKRAVPDLTKRCR